MPTILRCTLVDSATDSFSVVCIRRLIKLFKDPQTICNAGRVITVYGKRDWCGHRENPNTSFTPIQTPAGPRILRSYFSH